MDELSVREIKTGEVTTWTLAMALLAGVLLGSLGTGYAHVVWMLRDTRAQLVAAHAETEQRQAAVETLGEVLRAAQPDRQKRGEAVAQVLERAPTIQARVERQKAAR